MAGHPLVDAARPLAAELAPGAARVEHEGVSRATLDRLAGAGLHGLFGPRWAGGSDAAAAVYREVAEILAGADGNTWLVWFQHHPVVKMLAASPNADLAGRQLPALCSGAAQAGVAFSHLRNPSPTIEATRSNGVWSLRGTQPWCTGWGLIDLVLVGAVTPDDEVLFALVPAAEARGLHATGELPLAAMAGTRTVGLELDGLAVGDDDVVLRVPRGQWAVGDFARSANVQPSAFGIARAALGALAEGQPDVAAPLAQALESVRAHAYRLADEVPTQEAVEERLATAARALLLGVEITSALVASLGGQGMTLASPAQRWAREALFHLVFAQNGGLRAATLESVSSQAAGAAGGVAQAGSWMALTSRNSASP